MGYIVDDIPCSYVWDGSGAWAGSFVRSDHDGVYHEKRSFTIIAHTYGTAAILDFATQVVLYLYPA
jgi:hypothetical protein